MENKILVLYLKPVVFTEDGNFNEIEIKKLCNNSTRNQNKEIFFLDECFIASFQYEGNNYAFVPTKENNTDKIDGVSWPTLDGILAQYIPGTYDIHFAAKHLKNMGTNKGMGPNLYLPVTLEFNDGGIGVIEFDNTIKSFWKKFGNDEFEFLKNIIIRGFKTKIKENVTLGKSSVTELMKGSPDKRDHSENEGSKSTKSVLRLDDLLKEFQQLNSIEEITIVISPYCGGNSIMKVPGKNKCFILIKEITSGEDIQAQNTENLKRVLATYCGKHVYMAIHGLSDFLDFAKIKYYGKKIKKTLYYCDFHHISEYTRIVEPYEKIMNEEDIEDNYERLNDAIKKEYWFFQMLEAINQVVSTFFPINIDIKGLEELPDESKPAYLNDIRQSIKEQQKIGSNYFIKKLVNLRSFINGDSSISRIDEIAPDIDIFEEFNMKSLENNCDTLKILKELSGLNSENSPITVFMRLLDQTVSLSNDSSFESIYKILHHFERLNWTIGEHKINNFNDWFLLLATSLTDIKKQMVNKNI